MIIVLNSLDLRGVSDVSLEYRGNCIKISQGVLPTGTAVTFQDAVAHDLFLQYRLSSVAGRWPMIALDPQKLFTPTCSLWR
jgi:hypothetical protein